MESIAGNVTAGGEPACRPGVIEILNRSGQVLQRLMYSGGIIRVGRAYDNDIIIGDPFVCPHHLIISTDEGRIILQDLDSLNGTWNRKGKVRLSKAELPENELLQFGHSQLRFRAVDSTVEPARKDTARRGMFDLLGRVWMLPLAATVSVLSLAAGNTLDSPRDISVAAHVGQLDYPLLGMMFWAGFWALINRLIAHRSNFKIHLSIVALAVAALFLNSQGVTLLGFALGWSESVAWIKTVGQILIIGTALIIHMKFATHGRAWVQAVGAGVFATILMGIPQYEELSRSRDFSSLPGLEPLLKPPAYRLVEGVSVDEFFKRSDALREKLEKDTSE